MNTFHPKLLTTLKDYTFSDFTRDALAGIIVAIIALPLSIALAISSGVTPEQGLYTAIIAGFIISLLGGSRVQIGGPTGAFMIIVFGIVAQYGMNGLIIATLMGGIMMVVFGLLRLGTVVKFIPCTITIGFTTGIAVTIFTSQIKDLLGLKIEDMPSEFISKWESIFNHLNTINHQALLIGLITIVIILLTPKLTKRIPGAFVALIVTSVIVSVFDLNVATIGSVFGDLTTKLPTINIPHVNMDIIRQLFPSALTIALLGSIESLLSAVVADGMTGGKHRSNTELIAQGIANIFSALFGGIPATGAIARTTANIKNGGRTPVAGMVHALVLLVIFLLFMPLAKLIPMPALAGILIIVAYNMSEIHVFMKMLKSPKGDVLVLLLTFALTVFVDLVVAIEFGMVISAFIFMRRMSESTYIKELIDDAGEVNVTSGRIDSKTEMNANNNLIQVYEINGPLFFGAAETFIDHFTKISGDCEFLILRMRHVSVIDSTGLRSLETVISRCEKNNIKVIITGLRDKPKDVLKKHGIMDRVGQENFFVSKKDAIEFAMLSVE
ncbi:sulfate permease [Acidaminobacter sp. JC074]|uniref:SulP family inorganic anion transporter n=1 Tax=Acidaminobacter sp. JC074 TaxID=2530199 RepID=UPI001F0DE585|nr:sulfate permease [Acidaminobacter sp. JC074]MCH4886723.1 sulfate permease [Acidaminobacter sp. JC074]